MTDLSDRLRVVTDRPVETAKAVVRQIRSDDVPFMAASIAYQAFVSLVPILVLLFFLVAAVGDQALADRAVSLTEGFLPDATQRLLSQAITGSVGLGSASASAIGLVTLIWGSLKIFRGLDTAFSEIYETSESNSIVDQLRDGVVVLGVLGLTVLAMVLAGSVFAVFEGPLLRVLNLLALLAGLTVAFLPVFRYFPDADLSWAEAVPGAVFAAVGWTVLQFLFQLYVAISGRGDGSGVIGAILLLMLWLYLGGLVLLIGAVVSAVLLGDDEPTPATDERERETLVRALQWERDRRHSLESEVERLEYRLDALAETRAADRLTQLRADRRQLTRQLRWERKPLPVRLALRILGRSPPTTPE